MDLGLKGKRALVMSSSRGLGLGIAEALAAEGADVLLTGRSAEALAVNVDTINARGAGRAHSFAADLSDPDSASALLSAAAEMLGGVDILVANTGGPPPGRMADADLSVMAAQFDTMVLRVMQIAAGVVPGMRERGWGRIVTVASSGVVQPIPNIGLSNVLRSALVGWSKSMSNDLAADGVTVNMVLPGRIHTSRVDELDGAAAKKSGKTVEEVAEASRATIPAGRYGTVQEFANVATFLASDAASYVTGGMIRVDGGLVKGV
ncbi:MAG: 3-oxoacyl-ACP reductase [Maritimibacter sp.]|nr:3-oxoacyl-ACP reductase [Maritimibacter sp.]